LQQLGARIGHAAKSLEIDIYCFEQLFRDLERGFMSWFISDKDFTREQVKKSIDQECRKYIDREWMRNYLLYQGFVHKAFNRNEDMEEYSKWVDRMIAYLYDENQVEQS
jgi:hypothetical protein